MLLFLYVLYFYSQPQKENSKPALHSFIVKGIVFKNNLFDVVK